MNEVQNSKLFQLLHSFSEEEWRNVRFFIESRPGKNVRNSLNLLQLLKEQEFQEVGELQKRDVYKHLFPEESSYDDIKMRQAFSALLKVIESFLITNHIEKNPITKSNALAAVYLDRGLPKHFNHALRKGKAEIEKSAARNANYYYDKYRFSLEEYQAQRASGQRLSSSDLSSLARNLDIFFLLEKLKLSCEILNVETITAAKHEILFFEAIIQHIDEQDYSDVPAIEIYYTILQTVMNPQGVTYKKLKGLLSQYIHIFPREEGNELYVHALNFCIRKINRGESEYLAEIFDLYKKMIEQKVLIPSDHLSPWTFKNIVVVGLRLEETDWVRDFIEQYSKQIASHLRENAYTYNQAKLFFYEQKYDAVLDLLQKVEYDDIFYSLDSKAMLLKTYYELDEKEALFSLLDSFRIFLRRKKGISASRKRNFANMLKFARKLAKTRFGDQARIRKLRKELEETEHIADVNWLKEKLRLLDARGTTN